MTLVSACDEKYFPLLRGLYLSLLESGQLPDGVRLAFFDLGCTRASLDWLTARGVTVSRLEDALPDGLGDSRYGYHRAQTCRPFLADLFPDSEVLGWIDCDTWFQDASVLKDLLLAIQAHPQDILISPEVHYTYTKINDHVRTTQLELQGYYAAIYGSAVADELCITPSVNSGFFLMHRQAPLWAGWKKEIERIYGSGFDDLDPIIRHFGEQISLNKLVKTHYGCQYFDPIYNYLCLWNPPFRDEQGVVRLSAPPYAPVGLLHLAGGWRHFGRSYYDGGLLYKGGTYLSESERDALLEQSVEAAFR
jgi:hypothetical protein